MVDLVEESAFWQWCAKQNTFIHHVPGSTGENNRFARFTDEGTVGELSGLGSPRLELSSSPLGNIVGDAAFQVDNMSRTVRVIAKVADGKDYAAKLALQNSCKAALFEMATYIVQSQQDGDACESTIMKMFNIASVGYQIIDNATSDGSFTGCQMKIQLRGALSQTPVTYGTFVYP